MAGTIIACLPGNDGRLIEPFAGSAAVSLAAAACGKAKRFVINDINQPLTDLWQAILNHPGHLCTEYARLWTEQLGRARFYYDEVRAAFNRKPQPAQFLYLLARCVKACVRYNGRGEFNNSPDNRRLGASPQTVAWHVHGASNLLEGRTLVKSLPYEEILGMAKPEDTVYMDPPYQGVCKPRDQRYLGGVVFDSFVKQLESLNSRDICYIVSYDGRTGDKKHGQLLPSSLDLAHFEVEAGRSTQATLLGRDSVTFESLYLSPALIERIGQVPGLQACCHWRNATSGDYLEWQGSRAI
jgi:DNA adenine methylase